MPRKKITLENFFQGLDTLFEKTGFKPSEKWQKFRSKAYEKKLSKFENQEPIEDQHENELLSIGTKVELGIQEGKLVLKDLENKEQVSQKVTDSVQDFEIATDELAKDQEKKLPKSIKDKLKELSKDFKEWREKRAYILTEQFKNFKNKQPSYSENIEGNLKDRMIYNIKKKLSKDKTKRDSEPQDRDRPSL